MAGYELVFEGYEFARDDEGVETGTQTFVARGGAERDLPALGTAFGDVEGTYDGSAAQPSSDCKLRKISCRVIGNDTKRYSCEYSTPDSSTSGVNHLRAPTETVESVRASVESFQVMGEEDAASMTWGDGKEVRGIAEHSVQMVVIHYTKEMTYSTLSAAISACSVSKLDTVRGNWLYEGFDISQMKDDDNDDVFRATRSYKYRSESWNKFYRVDKHVNGNWEEMSTNPYGSSSSFPDSMPF